MTALLVDGNNVLVRAIRAMEHARELSVGGVPTGPTHVFVNTVARHVREERPDHVVICWDGGKSKFRRALQEDYKGARKATHAQDDTPHFQLSKEFLARANVFQLEVPEVEADDLIAAYWRQHRPLDERIVILSSDKDFMQLILEGQVEQVKVSSANAETERITAGVVLEKTGAKPEHLPYVMALMGDKSDGVVGVPGIGPKTAVKILDAYNWNFENVVRFEERIKEYEERVRMNLKLVNLRDVGFELEVPRIPRFRPATKKSMLWLPLLDWLDEYQFKNIRDRVVEERLWMGPR